MQLGEGCKKLLNQSQSQAMKVDIGITTKVLGAELCAVMLAAIGVMMPRDLAEVRPSVAPHLRHFSPHLSIARESCSLPLRREAFVVGAFVWSGIDLPLFKNDVDVPPLKRMSKGVL